MPLEWDFILATILCDIKMRLKESVDVVKRFLIHDVN